MSCSHADPLTAPPRTQLNPNTVVLTPAKDNTLYEPLLGQLSNGAGRYFFAGRSGGGTRRRGLIAFDVAAVLPAGTTVSSAILTLHVSRTIVGPQSVALHNVLADWGESTSDSNILGGGMGAPAAPGDATWIHTHFDTSMWANPGGDFEPAASGKQIVDGLGFYEWSSPQMAADVQSWLDDPSSNFGWMVIGPEGQGQVSTKRFDTRESGTAAFRPRLTIELRPAP